MSQRRESRDWAGLFVEFEQSGQTAAAFCRERGIPTPYFRTKYRSRVQHSEEVAAFQPVALDQDAGVQIHVGDIHIQCEAGVPSAWLATLVQQLRT